MIQLIGFCYLESSLIKNYFDKRNVVASRNLKALVTAGPTREYIDPIRYISNESSGKQGYEIAIALHKLGIKTTKSRKKQTILMGN